MPLRALEAAAASCAGIDIHMLHPICHRDSPSLSPQVWSGEIAGNRKVADESYAQQYERTFSVPYDQVDTSSPLPKPSNEAQAREPFARRAPFSRVWGTLMRPVLGRTWSTTDIGRLAFFSLTHVALVLAPTLFFSWRNLAVAFLAYCMGGMGITYSYHRQLAHRSFRTPKWLEYVAAYVGAMFAVQGAPMEWVSDHRYHHLHTETPLDPHSSYEGFWWSHVGWMLDSEIYMARCGDRRNVRAAAVPLPGTRHTSATPCAWPLRGIPGGLGGGKRVGTERDGDGVGGIRSSATAHLGPDRPWPAHPRTGTSATQPRGVPALIASPLPPAPRPARQVADLAKQPFYRHLEEHYLAHLGAHFALIAVVGALVAGPAGAAAALCWRWAGVALLYHVTWFVNSAAHLWGSQPYRTGDQSRNNWWVGFLAFGEGWHNNHHAFEYSARHGLGPRQFDVTWLLIAALRKLGLATHVKLPSEAAKAKLAV